MYRGIEHSYAPSVKSYYLRVRENLSRLTESTRLRKLGSVFGREHNQVECFETFLKTFYL